jgi:hypothetical protein
VTALREAKVRETLGNKLNNFVRGSVDLEHGIVI